MKKIYTFKIDQSESLVCTGMDNTHFYKRGINAIKLLKKINKQDLNISVENNKCILKNDLFDIEIEDFNKFKELGYMSYLNNQYGYINVCEVNNKKKEQKKYRYKVMGSFAATTLFASVISMALTAKHLPEYVPAENSYAMQKEAEIEAYQRREAARRAYEEEQAIIIEEQNRLIEAREQEEQAIADYNKQKEAILEQIIYIDVNQDWEDSRRYTCYEVYGDAIDEIAPKFGFSPNIIKAMASQEGGGYLPNVMQVNQGWFHKKLEYYDNELNEWHYICGTSEETHDTEDTLYVSFDDPNLSIYYGCTILAMSINRQQGNLLAGMIEYNRGNADGLVNQAASSEGVSHDEFLEDYYNSNIQYYDYNTYIQACLKFMDNDPITYKYVNKETGEIEYITWYPVFKNTEEEDVILNNLGEEPERIYTVSDNSISENSVSVNSVSGNSSEPVMVRKFTIN